MWKTSVVMQREAKCTNRVSVHHEDTSVQYFMTVSDF